MHSPESQADSLRAGAAAPSMLPAQHGQLPRWDVADLPAPPPFNWRNMLAVIGPGAIMAATSIGGGEWLVCPAAAVKYSSHIFLNSTGALPLQGSFISRGSATRSTPAIPIFGVFLRPKSGPPVLGRVSYSWFGFF